MLAVCRNCGASQEGEEGEEEEEGGGGATWDVLGPCGPSLPWRREGPSVFEGGNREDDSDEGGMSGNQGGASNSATSSVGNPLWPPTTQEHSSRLNIGTEMVSWGIEHQVH